MPTQLKEELGSPLDMGADGLVQVSQWMNQGAYEGAENQFNLSSIRNAAHIAKAIRGEFTHHHELRLNPNPKHTDAQNRENLKRERDALDARVMSRIRGQMADFARDIKAKEFELDEAANLHIDRDFINAVTGSFHGLKPADRQVMITRLIEDGEGSDLAILIKASVALTGLTKEERQLIRRRAWEKVNPTGVKQLDQLQLANERFEAGAHGTVGKLTQLQDGLNRYDADIAKAEAVTRKPSAGFAE